jgi:trigger factor
MCGLPIVQYDHIEDFARVREHKASNITALCPQHHDDKTHKRLPAELVRARTAKPYNLRNGRSTPYLLHYGTKPIEVVFGSSIFTTKEGDRYTALKIDDTELVSWRVEDGVYLLTVRWFDDDGTMIFEIDDNELVLNTRKWDIEFVGNRLTIRSGERKVVLVVTFEPPKRITFLAASFRLHGNAVQIRGDKLIVNTTTFSRSRVSGSLGVVVGKSTGPQKGIIQRDTARDEP